MVIYLEQVADLHMAQLMPLPLTVSCFSKIHLVVPFCYRLTRVVPEKGPLNGCVYVCMVPFAGCNGLEFCVTASYGRQCPVGGQYNRGRSSASYNASGSFSTANEGSRFTSLPSV